MGALKCVKYLYCLHDDNDSKCVIMQETNPFDVHAGEVAAFGDDTCEVLGLWQQGGRRHVHEGPGCPV